MKLILIGMPGAGKSTQGNLLSKQLQIPYLSTGHIFRKIAEEKTDTGRYVRDIMTSGQLIPDERTIPIVRSYLSRPEYRAGYILDGFPRTKGQAVQFVGDVDKAIYLEIPDKEALWRLAYRKGEARTDDTLETIAKRIEIFHKKTRPVTDYFGTKGKLFTIDGTDTVEGVNTQIAHVLGKKLVNGVLCKWTRKSKLLLAIVGLPGSGKTEAARYLSEKEIPTVHFGDSINKKVDDEGLEHTTEVHKKLVRELRTAHGMDVLAKLSEKKLSLALLRSDVVVIDGLRSWEECDYLRKSNPQVELTLVGLVADRDIRYARVQSRKSRNKLGGAERDMNEIQLTGVAVSLAMCDYFINNNGSIEALYSELDRVYRKAYFG